MPETGLKGAQNIRIVTEYVNPKRRIHGKRYLECIQPLPLHLGGWDDIMRDLLTDLLRSSNGKKRAWHHLVVRAGVDRLACLRFVVDALLAHGVIRVHERLYKGTWSPDSIEILNIKTVRDIAGLPDRDALTEAANNAIDYQADSAFTRELINGLRGMRVALIPRRVDLVRAIDNWMEEGREGTRRDFAQFAKGSTKAIHDADWRWLQGAGALDWAGIAEHEPLLLTGGSITLQSTGLVMEIDGGPVGIPQTAILKAIVSTPRRWIIFENRTVMDRACRIDTVDALLWVPGYAPGWWLNAVEALVAVGAAPAVFACDPDPAGVEIAHRASAAWRKRSLPWTTEGMDEHALKALASSCSNLNAFDHAVIDRIAALVADTPLSSCLRNIAALGKKGEQEGYWTSDRLTTLLTGPLT